MCESIKREKRMENAIFGRKNERLSRMGRDERETFILKMAIKLIAFDDALTQIKCKIH